MESPSPPSEASEASEDSDDNDVMGMEMLALPTLTRCLLDTLTLCHS